MDSSLLLMEPYGFIEADDIRYHKTVEAVKKALFHKGLMYRYNSKDDFGLPTLLFTICTFWLIRALLVTGHKEEARCLFDEVLKYSNHLGLFSEDIGFRNQRTVGQLPAGIFTSGISKYSYFICRRREEVIFYPTLEKALIQK